jgi:hypothetical protein
MSEFFPVENSPHSALTKPSGSCSFWDVLYSSDPSVNAIVVLTLYGTREDIENTVVQLSQVRGDSDGEFSYQQA